MCFVRVQVVHPYSCINAATAWKKSNFILSDFYIIDNLPIVVQTFVMYILTPLSVDEMLLLTYGTNLRGLRFKVEMVPS